MSEDENEKVVQVCLVKNKIGQFVIDLDKQENKLSFRLNTSSGTVILSLKKDTVHMIAFESDITLNSQVFGKVAKKKFEKDKPNSIMLSFYKEGISLV